MMSRLSARVTTSLHPRQPTVSSIRLPKLLRFHAQLASAVASAEVRVLPDHRAAHAEADAHRREPVADLGVVPEARARWIISRTPELASGCPRRSRHRTDSLADRSRRCPKWSEEGEHLYRKGLVDLEGARCRRCSGRPCPAPSRWPGSAHAHHLRIRHRQMRRTPSA